VYVAVDYYPEHWPRERWDVDARFQRDHVRILRQCSRSHFVTHNFMGLFSELNYYDLAEDLDHVSWGNYLAGTTVRYAVGGEGSLAGHYFAVQYVDWVLVQGAEALARYHQWHLEPFAPATRNRFGKGAAYYVGTVIEGREFYDALVGELLRAAGVEPPLRPPDAVEVSARRDAGKALLFVINHTEEPRSVSVPSGKPELLSGASTERTLKPGAFDVTVIEMSLREI